jgi:hypothetical protein
MKVRHGPSSDGPLHEGPASGRRLWCIRSISVTAPRMSEVAVSLGVSSQLLSYVRDSSAVNSLPIVPHCVQRNSPLDLVLGPLNPVRPSRSYFSTTHFNPLNTELELFYDCRFTANQFVLASSPLRLTTRDFFLFRLNSCGNSPYVTSSLTRRWVCLLWICLASRQVYISHI